MPPLAAPWWRESRPCLFCQFQGQSQSQWESETFCVCFCFSFLVSHFAFISFFFTLPTSLCFFSSKFQFCLSAVCFVITYSNKINDYEAPSQRQEEQENETATQRERMSERERVGERKTALCTFGKSFVQGRAEREVDKKPKTIWALLKVLSLFFSICWCWSIVTDLWHKYTHTQTDYISFMFVWHLCTI